ncbi:DUF969 domain-containing protein [uncultured Lactococcus sp.]|uniref:DUF969 domain-containing protein n=1 Tax=uncultured Lactococcus sp. TaxID=167973 RepID=UPI0027DE6083|nr:DUF969 domain-containing protein [uncultured Lactococcus sp.]
MIKLIGVLIVLIGFVFKIETLFVVVVAGISTGLVAGLSIQEILTILGQSFVDNRMVSLFVLTLPVIGVLERNGLRQRAVDLIGRIQSLTTGRIALVYVFIRFIAGAMSIRISGHPQFVRPLIQPMAKAAVVSKFGDVESEDDDIKAISAAAENYGNFFGQNLFAGSAGVLLITSTMSSFNYDVSAVDVAVASIIMAVLAFLVTAIQFVLFDRKLLRKFGKKEVK